jgi:hypothetical protein
MDETIVAIDPEIANEICVKLSGQAQSFHVKKLA